MKQKFQLEMGLEQYKNAATLLRTWGIKNTNQLSIEAYIFVLAQETQNLSANKL